MHKTRIKDFNQLLRVETKMGKSYVGAGLVAVTAVKTNGQGVTITK